jgi:glycosyltransferase involved in cell wall biosynthesis
MSEPKVTVVIPAFRAAHTISRAVESALSQTRPPDEIVVIDDGSPDDLAGALSRYAGRVSLVRKTNGGAASARNLAIERSSGELIAFLDADDYWEPTKLERQLEIMRAYPEVQLVASRYFTAPPQGGRSGPYPEFDARRFGRVLTPTGPEAFKVATIVWTSTVLARRSGLGDNRFVSGLEPAEDRDLWVRLVASGSAYIIPDALATAVLEPGSLSRSSLDVDCTNMLRVVHRNAALLRPRGVRAWEAHVYGRWAGNHLAQGRRREAVRYAATRLRLQPFSVTAWWILIKSLGASALGARTSTRQKEQKSATAC